ncbi:hypothetical protein BGZ83_000198 [Gryganskiella cystojenkinii]|nr:hypothetical protein BGZ83_000198 [Gryganskiella cystojenkinii]
MVKRVTPLLSFLLLGAVISRGNLASGSVISANKASLTNFELQTNLVTCGSSEGSATPAPPADAASAMSVAVCSPPESKLFGNVKIVNGTPHPGPTGVRGRLYDVGTLCDAKVADKIDRAWVAFLDCSGSCTLATKLANLESSNPQAILIYNQTSCIFPVPQAPPPAPAAPIPSSSAVAAPVSTTPPEPAAPVETEPAQKAPSPPPPKDDDDGGGKDGDGDNDGGGGGGDNDDDAESNNKPKHNKRNNSRRRTLEEDQDQEEAQDQEDAQYVHSPRPRPRPIIETRDLEKEGADGHSRSPKPRPGPHHAVGRRDLDGKATAGVTPMTSTNSGTGTDTAAVDITQATINFGTTVAIIDSNTVDYLFKTLLGPASNAPLPTALRALRTIAHPSQAPELGKNGNSNSITDLMVSISPSSSGGAGSGDPKFLSMSKPIFATVIGILSVVVCAVVLAYVVRPLYLRHRRKNEDRIEELEENGGNTGGFNNYHHDDSMGGSGLGTETKLEPEQFYEHYQQEQPRRQSYGGGSNAVNYGYGHGPVMPELMPATPAMNEKKIPSRTLHYDNDVNTDPAAYQIPAPQPQQPTFSKTSYFHSAYETASTTTVTKDEALFAQRQLRRLREGQQQRQQQQEANPVSSNVVPGTETNLRRASMSFDDNPESGLPAWRQQKEEHQPLASSSVTTTTTGITTTASLVHDQEPVRQRVLREDERDAFAADEWEEDPVPSPRRSSGSRHGSELFNLSNLKKSTGVPSLDVTIGKEGTSGGLASGLYRQRQSMETNSASTSTPLSLSAHTASTEQQPPLITTTTSTDANSGSGGGGGGVGAKSSTPRASFSDDFPRRPSSEFRRL